MGRYGWYTDSSCGKKNLLKILPDLFECKIFPWKNCILDNVKAGENGVRAICIPLQQNQKLC